MKQPQYAAATKAAMTIFCLSLVAFVPAGVKAQETAPDYTSRILTPPAPATPYINGPRVYGERPNRPFVYTVPATGDRPMTFGAKGLPRGLQLNAQTGQITGSVEKPGEYKVTLSARNATGQTEKPLKIVIGNRIALTPPMGWNSWNSWAGSVDQDKVLRSARVLVSSGLINHGWSYVNIDDTWQGGRTGPTRALQGNEKFPDLKNLCDQIHAMGLKAGIYSSPWMTTYAHYPGGSANTPEGTWTKDTQANNQNQRVGPVHFADSDAKQWADWGFDYLKYDWNPNDVASTTEMSDALQNSGRDIVFSLSNSAPIEHGTDWAKLSNAWRTTGDIVDTWGRSRSGWQRGVGEIGFGQDKWAQFSGPGHWNDPDMLVVGYVSLSQRMHFTHLTADEQFTHITLWSLLNAPLLIGCDLERLDPFTLSLLTNDEVIAVNQDSLGKQAVKISGPEFVPPAAVGVVPRRRQGQPPLDEAARAAARAAAEAAVAQAALNPPPLSDNPGGNALVYARPLDDGTQAVGLFNVGSTPLEMTVLFSDLKIKGQQIVRDLWRQKDMGSFADKYTTTVPPHGTVLVKIGTPRR